MFKRVTVLVCVILSILLFGHHVEAGDQRCFTKKQCEETRALLGAGDDGFYTKPDAQAACGVAANKGKNAGGADIGFCAPIGQSITKISFGGRRSFANIGEFIQYAYRYGMWLAGIIAVALIVISGIQWAASGGNSDMIGSAKNRITGAITGLILLALSYTILSNINPYLVQLRLPQAWMINAIGLAQPFCSEVKNAKVTYLSADGDIVSEADKNSKLQTADTEGYPIDPANPPNSSVPNETTLCGHAYLVQGTNGQSCVGTVCGLNEKGYPRACLPFDVAPVSEAGQIAKLITKSTCWSGQLVIHYRVSDLWEKIKGQTSDGWIGALDASDGNDWLQDQATSGLNDTIKIYPVCSKEDGSDPLMLLVEDLYSENFTAIYDIIQQNGFKEYIFRYSGFEEFQKKKKCSLWDDGSHPLIQGVVVQNEINENWGPNSYILLGIGPDSKTAEGYTRSEMWKEVEKYGGQAEKIYLKYIPFEKVTDPKKGLFLTFDLGPDLIQKL